MKTRIIKIGVTLLAGWELACVGQPTLQFSTNAVSAAEDAGAMTFTVLRLNDTNGVVTVEFYTADATAMADLDYVATNGTLTFAEGEASQKVTVRILNDGLVEGTYETITVRLENPSGGAALGNPAIATGRIYDNDAGLQFEFGPSTFSSYRAGETEGLILLGVARRDDGDFPVSVGFATSDGTATNGLDYGATNGTLWFAPGQKVAVLTVPILNDGLREANETFRVNLSNPTNQVLAAQNIATVTIVDNDQGVQFEPYNQYRVAENEGVIVLKVARGNDGEVGPITVNYATANMTASADLDYTGTSGTLSFAAGESFKPLPIPIVYDGLWEADEQFRVLLSNPTGGAVLGPYATATVTVLDITNSPPHCCAGIATSNGCIELALDGCVDLHFRQYFDLYPVEVSSNLTDWQPVATLLRSNSAATPLNWTDTQTTNVDRRFYRTASAHSITPWVEPTGPLRVGLKSRCLTDPSRRNRHGISTNSSLMVSVWYPALPEAGCLPAHFASLQMAQDPTWLPTVGMADFGRMPYFRSHAFPDAPCVTSQGPYPVVLYSPGHTGPRWLASEIGPNLASHGYVIVSVDHYDVVRSELPDGTYVQPYTGDVTPITATGLQDRARDLVFIMDELVRWNASDPVFAGMLDLSKVASIGGSWGGVTATEFGRIDARCQAVVGLDPMPFNTAPQLTSVRQPALQINAADNSDTFLYAHASTAVYFKITQTTHFLVAAMDWNWLWDRSNPSGGREIARTVNAYVLWFLNKHLKGMNEPRPTLTAYPRVSGYVVK